MFVLYPVFKKKFSVSCHWHYNFWSSNNDSDNNNNEYWSCGV